MEDKKYSPIDYEFEPNEDGGVNGNFNRLLILSVVLNIILMLSLIFFVVDYVKFKSESKTKIEQLQQDVEDLSEELFKGKRSNR